MCIKIVFGVVDLFDDFVDGDIFFFMNFEGVV